MKQKLVHLARLAAMCCLLICTLGGNAFAQKGITINGKVIDNSGQPVIGAGVTISGTTIGVAADLDGQFQITVPSESSVITVSALGYLAKEVEIGKKQNLIVVLDDEAESLDATVVVAYGTQTKATITGALSSIDSKELVKAPVADISNVLSGQLPGVTTVQVSGKPGDDYADIYVRGVSSLSDGASTPLILVDGVERRAKDYNEFQQYKHTATGRDIKGNPINTAAAAERRGENFTCPIAYDKNGNMLTDAKGEPLKMYYVYNNDGGTRYQFNGGDAIYEDVNSDGQIDRYDMVYLGNSNPKFYGGGGLTFFYDKMSLNIGLNFRVGSQVVNLARMTYESMRDNNNQSYATTWRWRKNGDITEIPRAINPDGTGAHSYNSLPSDRYVENGDYFRLQYIQFRYDMDPKQFGWMKKCGIRTLNLSASLNNLFCWSKYTGVDPEVSPNGFNPAIDYAKVPRSKSFTCSINLGF